MVNPLRSTLSALPLLSLFLLALALAVPTQVLSSPLVSVELRTEPGKLGAKIEAQMAEMLRAFDEVSLVRHGGELVLAVAAAGQSGERTPVTSLSVVLLQPLRNELLLGMVEREQHHAVRSLTADAFRVLNHWILVESGENLRALLRRAVALFDAQVLEPERETRRVLARRGITLVQQRLSQLGYQPGTEDGVLRPETRAAIRRFQASKGLPVDGEYSLYLVRRLETEVKRKKQFLQ